MMISKRYTVLGLLFTALAGVDAHIALWHKSMWGFNVTDHTYSYDNRPVAPLLDMTFDQWWFHGHLDHPPNPGDFFELPAGQPATAELACNKGATTFFASSEGGDIRLKDNPNDPCPGSDMSEWHTTGINDLFGCALGITYQSDVNQVKPEDFAVFSVNQTCVWTRFTDFQVPAKMPPCPPGGCICAWFWIHSPDSGGEQNYMNGFRCNVTGSTSNVALAKPQIARRCGKDLENGKLRDSPGNCTYGAKQPFYWFQKENNNMFEGTYSPPRYLDMYNFRDGAQNDIFLDSYPEGIPSPGPNQTVVPTPFLRDSAQSPTTTPLSAIPPVAASDTSTSIPAPSISSSQSASAPISGSTVVKTSVVTVTVPASPVSSSVSTTVRGTTATVLTTVVVTISDPVPALPVTSASPTATVTVVNTVFATATAGISADSGSGTSQNGTKNNLFLELDDTNANSTTANDTISTIPIAAPASSSRNKVCKREVLPGSGPRESKPRSFFHLPGSRSYRKLTKKSSLWHIF